MLVGYGQLWLVKDGYCRGRSFVPAALHPSYHNCSEPPVIFAVPRAKNPPVVSTHTRDSQAKGHSAHLKNMVVRKRASV
jgi:hypothetical protein